jgi:hypothetical protein
MKIDSGKAFVCIFKFVDGDGGVVPVDGDGGVVPVDGDGGVVPVDGDGGVASIDWDTLERSAFFLAFFRYFFRYPTFLMCPKGFL